jgi:hypothetical protein
VTPPRPTTRDIAEWIGEAQRAIGSDEAYLHDPQYHAYRRYLQDFAWLTAQELAEQWPDDEAGRIRVVRALIRAAYPDARAGEDRVAAHRQHVSDLASDLLGTRPTRGGRS